MQFMTISRVLGILLMLFSLSMLPPMFVSWLYEEEVLPAFIIAFTITITTGYILWLSFSNHVTDLKVRDGFVIVVLFWIVLSAFGAIPFIAAKNPDLTISDAMFEAFSGLTTTGATILTNLDELPFAIRYYRQQLQFLGGMGIIVLAVAILPMLGIGGMQLYRAETPGPMKDNKLTPRITETAKALWFIYLGLFASCTLAYWVAGMSWFEAIGESFGTISTGGFALYDQSIGHYNNSTVELIAVVFMFLGGVNFALHFTALRRKNVLHYFHDDEFRTYLLILVSVTVLVTFILHGYAVYDDINNSLIKSLFNVVSIGTTTGLTSADFASWPTFVPILLMYMGIVGGCAASTSGGLKVMRVLLLVKQIHREIRRLIHPNAVYAIKFGKQILPEHVTQAMWGFISVFIGLFVILLLALMATGIDLHGAFGALVGCLANVGVATGSVAADYSAISPIAKWILIFAMVAGRLEIFTLLILFSPDFWRK